MEPIYSERVQTLIDLLSGGSEPSDNRAYIVSLLEAGLATCASSIELNKQYAQKNEKASHTVREGAFDFRSEMRRWEERAERYESDLGRIRISDRSKS